MADDVETGASDRELVGGYLEGRTEEAFRRLYRRHCPYLYCLALRLTGGRREEAEETVQEAWTRAARKLGQFRWRSSLRTWLAGFVINCCRELQHRRKLPPADLTASSVAVEPGLSLASLDLERWLEALPDGQREVVVLFAVEGYTHEEIAELLEIAPGTSKSRLFEARRSLRRRRQAASRGGGERP